LVGFIARQDGRLVLIFWLAPYTYYRGREKRRQITKKGVSGDGDPGKTSPCGNPETETPVVGSAVHSSSRVDQLGQISLHPTRVGKKGRSRLTRWTCRLPVTSAKTLGWQGSVDHPHGGYLRFPCMQPGQSRHLEAGTGMGTVLGQRGHKAFCHVRLSIH